MAQEKSKTIKVTLVKSAIGYSKNQKKIVQTLGLRKLGQSVEHPDTPVIRGMVNKVPHLVAVEDSEA